MPVAGLPRACPFFPTSRVYPSITPWSAATPGTVRSVATRLASTGGRCAPLPWVPVKAAWALTTASVPW